MVHLARLLWMTLLLAALAACGPGSDDREPVATARPFIVAPTRAPATTRPVTEAYYANCSEARAAGAAPLSRGQPGYRSALDRDDDGVACE